MKLSEYIGQDKAVLLAKNFMQSWKEKAPISKAMLFFGPPGVGKSSLVPALALQYRTPLVKKNLSRDRDVQGLENAAQVQAMDGGYKLIFLDECDKMSASIERDVLSLIKNSKSPIILACNYIQRVPISVRKQCLEIQFERPEKKDLKEYAMRVYSENPTVRASGADMVSVVSRARSYRQVKHALENGAEVYDSDCYVDDSGAMVEAMFAGAKLGLKAWQGQELVPWVYDNCKNRDVPEMADRIFAMYRRVGRPLGDLAVSVLELSAGDSVKWPWSLRARTAPPPKPKPTTEAKKLPTRGAGNLKLQAGGPTIDDFL